MAFEAFLSDSRGRPVGPRLLGYLTSVAAHGPPVGLFVAAWLHHAMIIGTSGDLPQLEREELVYRIPISLKDATWGMPGRLGSSAAQGDDGKPRTGEPGRPGGRGRRGLVYREHPKTKPVERVQVNDLEFPFDGDPEATDGDDTVAGPSTALGTGLAGLASGESGSGSGSGGGGRGRGGLGGGTGGGMPMAVPAVQAKGASNEAGQGRADRGANAGDVDGVAALAGGKEAHDPPVIPGRPIKASFISERLAKYFRTSENFPTLGEAYWSPGRMLYLLLVEICVSTDGSVGKVSFKQSASPEVDQRIEEAIRTWRYRPRLVGGQPRPFCHPIRIEYTRQIRSFGR